MNYFAGSTWNYLEQKIRKVRTQAGGGAERLMLVMVPGLSEAATLALAEKIATKCAADPVIHLTLKIAQVVTNGWSPAGLATARAHDWLDNRGNLTYYRNIMPVSGRLNVVILCGADRVTDAGSLADFHTCDLKVVWHEEMKGSFQSWVLQKLRSSGIAAHSMTELKDYDRLLKPLLEQGRADLLQISGWLERLDLSAAASVHDALKIMLRSFETFQLPLFTRFPLGRRTMTLAPYIEKANAFFTYGMFLENKEREKAIATVGKIFEKLASGDEIDLPIEDADVRGPYVSGADLLAGLRNYILTDDRAEREKLKQCDFITIIDKILKFRVRREGEPTEPKTIRKISGSPVEMVLHALWKTFREFVRDRRYVDNHVVRVEIAGERFKHDYESSDGNDDQVVDRNELARQYLSRLLGGVEDLIKKQIELSAPGGETVVVACKLTDDEISCVYSKTAEPLFEFSVCLLSDAGGEPFCRKYAWRLPEIHSYRLAESLIHWANDALMRHSGLWKMPVFHLPYYEELLRATDDEETRRVMLHCVLDAHPDDAKVTNLLSREWLESGDALLPSLKTLSGKYADFVSKGNSDGLHAALFGSEWMQLRQAYTDAGAYVVQQTADNGSQMIAMLMRSFLVVQQRRADAGTAWGSEFYERSGIATVLHPAVLEMLEAQALFLFTCFNAAAATEWNREERSKAFTEKVWNGYVDLSSIQAPLAGLLYNEDLNLDTNVRGQDLIHRIGSPEEREATLTTRLLLREDGGAEDEEVADVEMFREGRESKLLYRLMTDYFRLHPHARDGLTLAVFRNEDIQPVIAAVHQYLNKLSDEKDRRYYVLNPERRKPYAIGVTVFTEASDDVDVSRWIEQWRERWSAAETDKKFEAYRRCRFSVAHRLVSTQELPLFQRLVKDSLEADIVVLYNFIGAGQGGNRFSPVAPFNILSRTLKFPILEKSCCAVRHPVERFKRSRVMSNLQFSLGKMHTQIMHRLKHHESQPGREFVVLGYGDYAPWRSVVDALHAKTEWVICIDPNIDERLIKIAAGEQAREREIIGFGSGVGSHGEANYTISSEQFSLADIRVRLTASVQQVYSSRGWSMVDYQAVASCVLRQAHEISGLSLVRATGVGHYIRDFMAYALMRKIFRDRGTVLCDHLISLDAYRHWFDMADDERRPDLMWLTARLDEHKRVVVDTRLIECKVAGQADEHLIKARTQINNGLKVLTSSFAPRSQQEDNHGEDTRPDQRYWWLQLHRLIASKSEIDNQQQADVLSALERLAEGDYEISWGAAVFAFWTDSNARAVSRIGHWSVGEINPVVANVYAMGSEFVRELARDGSAYPMTWSEWHEKATKDAANVCDELRDIELPTSEEDDEDTPEWEDEGGVSGGLEEEEQQQEETPADSGPATEAAEPAPPTAPEQPTAEKAAVVTTGVEEQPKSEQRIVATTPTLQAIPKRILLGKTVGGGKPVYWEFGHPDVANRHMIIFGTSGMGKTYAIQCLLSELGRAGQNSLVLDYTDGFILNKLEPVTQKFLRPSQYIIRQKPLPINPFKAHVSRETGIELRDTPVTIAKRVAAIFKSVYELGNQQFPVLIDAINEGVGQFGDDFNLALMLDILESYVDDTIHSAGPVRTTISKLKPFIQSNPFAAYKGEVGWEKLFTSMDERCHIFQFHMIDRHSARTLIEFVLWDLYSYVSSIGNKDTPRVIILDEIQNLDLGPDAPVAKYLTEGRKHGLALITATQTVRGVGGVSDPRVSRLFQAEQKLFFKPTENEMREHAQLLHNAISNVGVQDWSARLASLQKGECWSLGRNLNEVTGKLVFQAQKIKITSLEERRFSA